MAGEDKSPISALANSLIKFAKGFQAQPAAVLGANKKPIKGLTTLGLPTMHRFLNGLGMVSGFIGFKYFTDILYGHKINGSLHEEIEKDKVFFLFAPLHNKIKSNPHSDRPKDRWLTSLRKLIPAVGGAAGAIAGSMAFFVQNGTTENMGVVGKMKNLSSSQLKVQEGIQSAYKQGKIWRIWAGATAWLASTSGITGIFYGIGLNQSFWSVNNAKTMAAKLIKSVKGGKPDASDIKIPKISGRSNMAILQIAAVGGAVAGAIGLNAKKRKKAQEAAKASGNNLDELSAQDYVSAVEEKHTLEKKPGFINGPLLNAVSAVSDLALAVIPVHRFWSATGLLVGGTTGMTVSRSLRKKVADHFGLQGNNKYLTMGGDYLFAAACALGVMAGSKYAYKKTDVRNEADTNSIEGALARVRSYQGKAITPLLAVTSVPGSAMGAYLTGPLSYGNPLMAKTLSMQDRTVVTPGLKWMTGTTGRHYFGLREALDYTAKYATYNVEERPEDLESLALTMLGPVAHACGVELKGEHVRKFTDQLTDIRDKYYHEKGIIPEEQQKKLMEELKAHFSGKGLDETLLASGIDVMNIDLKKIGGGLGWFAGNVLGANKKIALEQKRFEEMVTGWRSEREMGVKETIADVAAERNDGKVHPKEKGHVTELNTREPEKTPDKSVAFKGDSTSQHGGTKNLTPGSLLSMEFSKDASAPAPA